MRSCGRLWLVTLVVCLALLPARSEASVIVFNQQLTSADEVFFQPFTIDGPSTLTGEVTAGFFPVLTLFGPDDSSTPMFVHNGLGYGWITEFQSFTDTITIDPFALTGPAGTRYLLALSQQPYLFSPFTGGFDSADPELTQVLESCGGFVNAAFECGDGDFEGSLSLESVPEPGTTSLLALGGAALFARRRRKRDGS